MEYISYQKTLPVAAEYDVIICGGGAAGIGTHTFKEISYA